MIQPHGAWHNATLLTNGRNSGCTDHPNKLPTLELRLRRALDDFHRVADMRLVVFIVNVANGLAMQDLAVLGVMHDARDLHATALGHLVGSDDADRNSLRHGSVSDLLCGSSVVRSEPEDR